MDCSIFMDKSLQPDEAALYIALGERFELWKEIREYAFSKYPKATEEWNYPGIKYGWSFRIKDKKRAILYLLPRERYFKVAFVFGQKAVDLIMESDIAQEIRTELSNARVYAEGRGIRIDIRDHSQLRDIFFLIDVKISH